MFTARRDHPQRISLLGTSPIRASERRDCPHIAGSKVPATARSAVGARRSGAKDRGPHVGRKLAPGGLFRYVATRAGSAKSNPGPGAWIGPPLPGSSILPICGDAAWPLATAVSRTPRGPFDAPRYRGHGIQVAVQMSASSGGRVAPDRRKRRTQHIDVCDRIASYNFGEIFRKSLNPYWIEGCDSATRFSRLFPVRLPLAAKLT